ncbi:MAG: hypothetical protein R2722_14945 [Tessaracoccus sp.]
MLTFSTTTGTIFAGSAGKAAAKALKKRRLAGVHGRDFTVRGAQGPLADGELDGARRWGKELVR